MSVDSVTHLFEMPRFRLPAGERSASWGPEADELCMRFARESGLLASDEACRFYSGHRYGTMSAYVASSATGKARELFAQAMTWLFIYDDWAEQLAYRLAVKDVTRVVETVCTWVEDEDGDCLRLDLPVARSLRRLWHQLRENTSDSWRGRYQEELRAFFRTAQNEAEMIDRNSAPAGDDEGVRFVATGGMPAFTLTELACGIELPPQAVHHKLIVEARWNATAAISFGNDIIGLKSDLLRGVRDNLVLALQQQHGGDLQENVDRAADKFHRLAEKVAGAKADYLTGRHQALPPGPTLDAYFAILEDWIYEGVKWQLRETNRYSTTVRLTHAQFTNPLVGIAQD